APPPRLGSAFAARPGGRRRLARRVPALRRRPLATRAARRPASDGATTRSRSRPRAAPGSLLLRRDTRGDVRRPGLLLPPGHAGRLARDGDQLAAAGPGAGGARLTPPTLRRACRSCVRSAFAPEAFRSKGPVGRRVRAFRAGRCVRSRGTADGL